MYAALIAEVDGLRLISPEGWPRQRPAVEGHDEVFGDRGPVGSRVCDGGPSVRDQSETTFGGAAWEAVGLARYSPLRMSLAVTKNLLTENSTLRSDCPHGLCLRQVRNMG